MVKIWEDIIPPEEIRIYEESGFIGNKLGIGVAPAMLIIDVQNRTVGDDRPILESIRMSGFHSSCGEIAWAAVRKIRVLLEVIREKKIPVFFIVTERVNNFDAGLFSEKIPKFGIESVHRVGDVGTKIPNEIAPLPGEPVVSKRQASAFFGTHLITQLNVLRVDSLIITGCTTSGCVRATVTDGFSLGFRPTVIQDCVYDRSQVSHKVSLFDMNSKFADVLTSDEIINFINSLK